MSDSSKIIGFANLSESQEFTRTVRAGLEAAAASYDDIELVLRDNDMDNDKAHANVEEFAEMPVDLAILFHIDERYNFTLNQTLLFKQIPAIAIDIPIPMTTYFGANNRQAGTLAGQEAGRWVTQHWGGHVDKVLVVTDYRILNSVQQRLSCAVSELQDHTDFDMGDDVFYIDGSNSMEVTQERAHLVLDRWSDYHNIVVLGLNDESTLGALEAARISGREEDVIGVGHGATMVGEAYQEINSRLIGSVGYFPERYGEHLIELARRILDGGSVPRENFIEHRVISHAGANS